MIISTRGRYALRAMIDLAEHEASGTYTPLKDVAERQGISHKYLESIMARLSRSGMVTGAHGKGGGYKLSRPAEKYTIYEILSQTENSLSTVACLDKTPRRCDQKKYCRPLPLWQGLDSIIKDYLSKQTLASLARPDAPPAAVCPDPRRR